MRGNFLTDLFIEDVKKPASRTNTYFDIKKEESDKLDYKDIITPSYEKGSEGLAAYVDDACTKIGRYLKDELKLDIKNFGGVQIKVDDLGKTYAFTDEGELDENSRVLGLYDNGKDEIVIDRELYQSRDRELILRVLGEELLHYVQDKLGIIDTAIEKYGRKHRQLIEGSAASTADDIFGPINSYTEEKADYRELVGRVGKRDAFLSPREI